MKHLSSLLQIIAILWLSTSWSFAVFILNPYRFTTAPPPPPPGGDEHFASVVLLLHCDGTNGSTTFTDNASTPKTITAFGDAQVTTTNSKFGTGAMLLDGTGDYVATASASDDFNFETSTDFTLECWANLQGVNDAYFFGTQNRSLYFGVFGGSIVLGNGVVNPMIYVANYAAYRNKWTHVALTRAGTTLRVFLDGEVKQTVASSTFFGANSAMNVGREPNHSNFNGRIDEARITKGVARYTANFTPPTAPFPDS